MAITITFTAATPRELRAELREFLGLDKETGPSNETMQIKDRTLGSNHTSPPPVQPQGKPVAEATFQAEEKAPETEVKSRKPRGPNKKKDEAKVDAPQPVSVPMPTTTEATLDSARQWGAKVWTEKGEKAAQDILVAFGVAKISQIPADKLGEFIEACEDVLAETVKQEDIFA